MLCLNSEIFMNYVFLKNVKLRMLANDHITYAEILRGMKGNKKKSMNLGQILTE